MNSQLKSFYNQLVLAAQVERDNGRLSMSESMLIRSLRLPPSKLQAVFEEAVGELCSNQEFVATCVSSTPGMASDGAGLAKSILSGEFKVDWEKLGDFIVKILPAILQIIALFL